MTTSWPADDAFLIFALAAATACGARSELPPPGASAGTTDAAFMLDVVAHAAPPDDVSRAQAPVDAAPPATLADAFLGRDGNLCIGFGLGEPVVHHPPPSLPLLCGLDCSSGEPCPTGARCYAVYEPDRVGTTWQVSDRIAGYQCGPIDKDCAEDEILEPYCMWCDADEECR